MEPCILPESIRIRSFASAVNVHDRAPHEILIKRRPNTALIFPMCGRIRFTQDQRIVLASPEQPVLVPEGATYRNECLDDADSLMLNLHMSGIGSEIRALPAPSADAVRAHFYAIQSAAAVNLPETPMLVLANLYLLLEEVIRAARTPTAQEALFAKAAADMERRLQNPALTVHQIAAALPVSDSYLYKLFRRYSGQSPQQFLRHLRMKHAQALLPEHSVTEVAYAVGYGDVYAFSRAYKQCFGISPSHR